MKITTIGCHMCAKKRTNKSKSSKDIEESSEIGDLINLVIQSLSKKPTPNEEALDTYAHKLMSHVRKDSKGFRRRLVEGYNTLLDVLKESIQPHKES